VRYQTVSNLGVARAVERASSRTYRHPRYGRLGTVDGAWLGGHQRKFCHKSILVHFRAHFKIMADRTQIGESEVPI